MEIEMKATVGWKEFLSGSNKYKALALAGGVALHAINVYLATTIMPSIASDIGGLEYYSRSTTIFVSASIIGSVISSNFLQKKGPRKAYRFAVLTFCLGSLICALAPDMLFLLTGRFIQGLGGGLLFALSYAMIRIVFIAAFWPRAMALVSGM